MDWLVISRSVRCCALVAVLAITACKHGSQLDEPVSPRGRGSSGTQSNGSTQDGEPSGSTGRDRGQSSQSPGSTRRDGGGEASAGNGGRSGASAGDDGNASSGSSGNASGGSGGSSSTEQDAGAPFVVPPFSKAALLESIGKCALASYRDFATQAHALDDAVTAFADSPDADQRNAARTAWLAAIASWERAELFRFGPAARAPELGAQDVRDEIYAFPLANPCKVDQTLVDRSYADASFADSLISARGLSALEYLLFYGGTANACLPSASINTDGSWDALDAGTLAQRRADYAAAVARNVVARADALVSAWDPDQGNFLAQLARPADKGSVYPRVQDAFNAISDGLFYLETEVKDYKLGTPLGLVSDCPNAPATCPDAVESRYARVSTENIEQNLRGFRAAFQGCGPDHAGLGFDDWLEQVGAGDLATRMLSALDDADKATAELDPKLEDAIVSDPARVLTVHVAIKKVTDLLKSELVTVLDLELPMSAEGDND